MENGSKRLARIVAAGAVTGTLFAGLLATPAGAARDVASACPASIPEDNFTDTGAEGSAIEEAVDCQKAYGITSGQTATTYNPSGTTSRAQMATFMINILKRVNGLTLPTNSPDAFTDDETSVHEANINIAADLDIVTGTGGTNYNPGGAVTREQMATFMVNTLKAAGATLPASGPDSFTDDETSVHEANINILNDPAVDIVDGTGGTNYTPAASLSRGQMAFFNTRGLDLLVDQGKVTPFGTPAATTSPELVSATVVSTVPSGVFAGTTIAYKFDEAVTAPAFAMFHAYNAGGGEPDVATAATVSSTDNTTVNVFFPTIVSSAVAGGLTLATVDFDAVDDVTGDENPEGDAPLNAAASQALPAGITSGPDLVSVGNFRASPNTDLTAVDFTYDEAVAAETGINGNWFLVALNGTTIVDCNFDTGLGTTTLTVLCEDNDLSGGAGGPTITAAAIARGGNIGGILTDAGGAPNVLQTADVSNSGNTGTPDLVSATFNLEAAGPADTATLVFDQAVIEGGNVGTVCAYYASASVAPVCVDPPVGAFSATTPTQVLVTFGDTQLVGAVGIYANAGAVDAGTGANINVPNAADEVGVANTSAATTAGKTTRPELDTVIRSAGTDIFGNPTGGFNFTYSFDEDVDFLAVGEFFLYLPDGTQLVATACANPAAEATDNTVTCTAYNVALTGAVASPTALQSAVLGTVDNGAVSAEGVPLEVNTEGASLVTAA